MVIFKHSTLVFIAGDGHCIHASSFANLSFSKTATADIQTHVIDIVFLDHSKKFFYRKIKTLQPNVLYE